MDKSSNYNKSLLTKKGNNYFICPRPNFNSSYIERVFLPTGRRIDIIHPTLLPLSMIQLHFFLPSEITGVKEFTKTRTTEIGG